MGADSSRYRGYICRGAENAIKVHGYVNGENQAGVARPDIKVSPVLVVFVVQIRGR